MLEFLKKKKPEKVFWDWFESRKKDLEEFIDSDHTNEFIYNRLTRKTNDYNRNVYPELSKSEEDKYILILTPDGKPEGLEPIEELFQARPQVDNWEIIKYRQPTDKFRIELEGISFPFTDIRILHAVDDENEKVHIKAYIPDYDSDSKKREAIAWLYLDHVLGEFNSITKLGHVSFENLDQEIEGSVNIIELRKIIDSELYGAST